MFWMKIDLCENVYCDGGIRVNYPHETKFSGHYDIQPIYVNDHPHFKMRKHITRFRFGKSKTYTAKLKLGIEK